MPVDQRQPRVIHESPALKSSDRLAAVQQRGNVAQREQGFAGLERPLCKSRGARLTAALGSGYVQFAPGDVGEELAQVNGVVHAMPDQLDVRRQIGDAGGRYSEEWDSRLMGTPYLGAAVIE